MKMKILRTLLLVGILLFISTGCIKTYTIPKTATRDSVFFGKWEGQHFHKEGGYWRKWEKTRIEDGTFSLVYIYYDQNDRFLDSELEKGDWWIHDGLYYQISAGGMTQPDSFNYEILSENQIKYIPFTIDSPAGGKGGYSFIEVRTQR